MMIISQISIYINQDGEWLRLTALTQPMDHIHNYFSSVFEKWLETTILMLWLSNLKHVQGGQVFPSSSYHVDVIGGYLAKLLIATKLMGKVDL